MSGGGKAADDGILRKVPVVDGFRMLGTCRILEKIGEGAASFVYRAYHTGFDFEVAVKCLRPAICDSDPDFVEKFSREARLAAKLTHPNLIRVYDVDEQHGIHFLVMEFVDGLSIAHRVRDGGPLPEEEAERAILQAARGLSVAHRANVVHRDIKPGNLLVSREGEVKVADLGLAKAIGSTEGLTATSAILGTPAYMSPEQWHDTRSVGAAGDVYSLGATWYALLTGKPPFRGTAPEIMKRVCRGEFPDVLDRAPGLAPFTTRMLDRCTALDPAERLADAVELAEAIERREPGTRIASAPDEPPAPAPPVPTFLRRRWKRVGLAAVLLLLSVVLFLTLKPEETSERTGSDPPTPPGDTAGIVPRFNTAPQEATPADVPDPAVAKEVEPDEPPAPPVTATQAPARYEIDIRTSPRLASLFVDGREIDDDGFGNFHLVLEEGRHAFRVLPRDGGAAVTFDYDVERDRRLLLDYESGVLSERTSN